MIKLRIYVIYDFLEIYFDEYKELLNAKRNKMQPKYDTVSLFLETQNYEDWLKSEESADTTRKSDNEECDMLPLEGDEEVQEGKGLKILNPNKLLTRLPILLAQIKAGNHSYKLKNEINKCYIFCISIIKSIKALTAI